MNFTKGLQNVPQEQDQTESGMKARECSWRRQDRQRNPIVLKTYKARAFGNILTVLHVRYLRDVFLLIA